MKQILLSYMRSKSLQPIWVKLHHLSLMGMNHWGAASTSHSGELHALEYMKSKLLTNDATNIFDVGANVGQYATMVSQMFGHQSKIYSFEPSKATFRKLQENVSNISNISFYNIGMGAKKETLKLYSSGFGSTIASVYNLHNPINEFKEEYMEEIDLTTIDAFCRENDIQSIDILKIDIEGHELYALEGACQLLANKAIRFIQFEFSECNIDSRTFFRDFFTLLEHYNLYRIVSNGLYPISEYTESLEVFHTANYLAELKTV